MDPARARYLRLQRELGGREVILSAPLAAEPGPAAPSSPAPPPTRAGAAARVDGLPAPDATSEPSPAPNAAPGRWRKDAPPVPGPGLVVAVPPDAPRAFGAGPWGTLEEVAAVVRHCTGCALCQERSRTVPGEGNPAARLMLVGEGPGATEDETGRPFVGRAGELLTAILEAIDLPRPEVFIANVVKCRPPGNRKPLPDEVAACLPYLERQVALIRPSVLVALGATAAEALLGVRRSLGELRGKVHSYHGIPLVVTYHPAALLRNPHWKKPTWDDVRIARQLLER